MLMFRGVARVEGTLERGQSGGSSGPGAGRSTSLMKSVPVRPPAGNDQGEPILHLPGSRKSIPNTTAFRSTWVVSSLESLRSGGHWDRYLEKLVDHHGEVLSCVAGVWLPIGVARAHYRACDALGLSSEEVTALGQGPGGQVRRAPRDAHGGRGQARCLSVDRIVAARSVVATQRDRRGARRIPSCRETSTHRIRRLRAIRRPLFSPSGANRAPRPLGSLR
jgi:hypothetical protein